MRGSENTGFGRPGTIITTELKHIADSSCGIPDHIVTRYIYIHDQVIILFRFRVLRTKIGTETILLLYILKLLELLRFRIDNPLRNIYRVTIKYMIVCTYNCIVFIVICSNT